MTSLLNKTCTIKSADGKEKTLPCRVRLRDIIERKYGDKKFANATHSIYISEIELPDNIKVIIGEREYGIIDKIALGGKTKIICLYGEVENGK
jgi:hypothetical protein